MKFKDEQRERGIELVREGFFDGDTGNGVFRKKHYPFVLQDGLLNLYPNIRNEALEYFKKNKIAWWGGKYPSAHILSSQIACLNHLFAIRHQKHAVLKILEAVSDDFIDVFPIPEYFEGYIQFEAVGGEVNFLNEGRNTRGRNCTSVDALIYALHQDGRRFLIPIEWKYAETYGNDDKSKGDAGKERESRYGAFVKNSQLLNKNISSCWSYEPFYQLMRQTLWTEMMLKYRPRGFEADDYLHLHVIPDGNKELLEKLYRCSNKKMEATWRNCLTNPNKYIVISPKQLWSKQSKNSRIYKYLSRRYW